MQTSLFPGSFEHLRHLAGRRATDEDPPPNALAWSTLPLAARLYVAAVIVGGVVLMVKFFPTTIPRRAVVCRAAGALVPHVGVEGQSSAPHQQRLDALGLLRGRSHGADAARPAAGDGGRRGRRLDAVHVQRQAAVSAVSHHLQHGGRSDHDAGDRSRLPVRSTARPGLLPMASLPKALVGGERHVLLRQHRPGGRGHRVVHAPEPVEGLARQLSLERTQLHGRRGRGRHRARW